MRILALDTSTRATSVALCDDEMVLEERDDPPVGARPGHAARLLPLAATLLERRGWDWGEVEMVVVGRGPGTFTGLRIGIATARGLASSLHVPLRGVSTLESLALGHERARSPAVVLAVLDARRREVFAAAWHVPAADSSEWRPDGPATGAGARRPSALGEPQLAPEALPPARLGAWIETLPGPALALGDGAIAFRDSLERAGATVPPDGSELHRVTAINHCRLARGAPPGAPDGVHPEYLRLPDAELSRRSRTQDAN